MQTCIITFLIFLNWFSIIKIINKCLNKNQKNAKYIKINVKSRLKMLNNPENDEIVDSSSWTDEQKKWFCK